MLSQQLMATQYGANFARETTSDAPRHHGRPSKPPADKGSEPVDPHELTRRLYAVLAERRAHAERRERARREAQTTWIDLDRPDGTRLRDGARPVRRATHQSADTSADLITELRKSKSTRHKSSHMDPTVAHLEATGHQLDGYHYVPREAATQFTRTTTVDNMRNDDLIHKLSKRALKYHKEAPRLPQADDTTITPSKFSQALRHAHAERDRVLDRNQFQDTRILEKAAHTDHHYHSQQSARKHTFEAEIARILPDGHHYPLHPTTSNNTNTNKRATWHAARRSSTGPADGTGSERTDETRRSLIALEPLMPVVTEDSTTLPPPARVDWTQSDETQAHPHPNPHSHHRNRSKTFFAPLLRKADSLWGLRSGRSGSRGSASTAGSASSGHGGKEKDKRSTTATSTSSTSTGGEKEGGSTKLKSTKSGFFARFKR